MPKQIKLYAFATVVTFAIVSPTHAQPFEPSYDIPIPPVIASAEQTAGAAGGATHSMGALLTKIAAWLSTNFDLPANQDQPRVEYASPMKLAAMRYKGMLPDRWREGGDPAMEAAEHAREVVAVYHDAMRTIFLPDAWTGTTPAELSVLVHEMVHHLQNLGGLKYECPAAREKPAYLAQDRWLRLHDLDLEKEFQIDKFTLVVSAACMS